jgi:hypothetical protein
MNPTILSLQVYKGLWRGTRVAVKTLVLPANMSGAEKMAVMEAAISSSLSHPSIVQARVLRSAACCRAASRSVGAVASGG